MLCVKEEMIFNGVKKIIIKNNKMKKKLNGISIEYEKINLSYKDSNNIIIYPQIRIKKFLIDDLPFMNFFSTWNNPSGNQIIIPSNIASSSERIFNFISSINDPLLSRGVADNYFENFTILWQNLLKDNKHILGISLWLKVLDLIWEWELRSKKEIHKGTPYFFLGSTLLMAGDLDKALLFISNAIEEDKRFSKKLGKQDFYKNLPAYLFSTMDTSNPNNFLFGFTTLFKSKLQENLDKYNKIFKRKFYFSEFDKRFLRNDLVEPEKYFFVYTFASIINTNYKLKEKLKSNSFSKLKNVNSLFNLCLIIDNTLFEKITEEFISGKIKEICNSKFNFSKKDCQLLYNNLDFKNNFEQAVKNCLSLKYNFKGSPVKKEILTLILLWGIRNYGGHQVIEKELFSKKFDKLLQSVLNAFFLSLEYLF
jgi:hypothetical protein